MVALVTRTAAAAGPDVASTTGSFPALKRARSGAAMGRADAMYPTAGPDGGPKRPKLANSASLMLSTSQRSAIAGPALDPDAGTRPSGGRAGLAKVRERALAPTGAKPRARTADTSELGTTAARSAFGLGAGTRRGGSRDGA